VKQPSETALRNRAPATGWDSSPARDSVPIWPGAVAIRSGLSVAHGMLAAL